MNVTRFLLITVVVMAVVMTGSAKTPMFSVDAATFKMPENWAYLEVYTLTPRYLLRYEPTVQGLDTLFEASFELVCAILSGEKVLVSDTVDAMDTVPDTSLITGSQNLPQVFTFQIQAGTYKLRCQIIDRKRGMGDVCENDLVVPDFPEDQLAVSDVELAIRLEREDGTSQFHKNGYLIYPNPQAVFGESLPRLNYYAEIYNLDYREGQQKFYYVDTEVLNSQQKSERSYERKIKPIAGPSMVEASGFPVTTYKSGTYYLKLTVTDSSSGLQTSRFKKFFVLHPSEIAQRAILEADGTMRITFPTDYSTLDEAQVAAAIEDIQYLIAPEEQRQLKKLNLEGKRGFLSQFWTARDPDASTPENEGRTEHYRRLGEANQMYGYLDIPGWKTDRGRVWILLGRPDTDESHPMEIDARAYKIWYYDKVEGGVNFVFVDKSGFGNYELVHSTKRGEINNPDWFNKEVQGYRSRERGQESAPLDIDPFRRGE